MYKFLILIWVLVITGNTIPPTVLPGFLNKEYCMNAGQTLTSKSEEFKFFCFEINQ